MGSKKKFQVWELPSQRLNLSPIENLWFKSVHAWKPGKIKELWESCQEEWSKLNAHYRQKLLKLMEKQWPTSWPQTKESPNIKSLNSFVRILNVALDAPKEKWGNGAGLSRCSDECYRRKNCRSFEVDYGTCYLSEYVTSDDFVLKPKHGRHFYQRIDPSTPFIALRHASIPYNDDLGTKTKMTLDECQESCLLKPRCRSVESRLMCKGCNRYRCDFSTADFLNAIVDANYDGWSIYILNICT